MIDKSIKFFGINIAILTISDTRNFDNDKSGSTLKKLVEDSGHTCISRDIVKDEPKELLSIFNKWISNKNLDVVITTGGTGLTGRDITVDVLETYFDKKIDGFGELFRFVSYKKINNLGFTTSINIEDGIDELIKVMQLVEIKSPYSNV